MKDFINIISNYFIHSLILFTFLTIFFIFYISKLVKETFVQEITHLIDAAMKTSSIPFKIPDYINLNNLINVYSKPDSTPLMFNSLLMKSLTIVNIILWVSLIIIFAILKYYNGEEFELSVILFENFLIFIFVGIIEFLFFKQIAFKFVPVEPSFIKTKLIDILQTQ